MITKVNNTNKDEYSVFFGKLSDSLGVEISSLAEYFNRLEQIKGLNNAAPYLTLPLDEPFFEIDANSRTINVPAEFKRNGVGVTGDSMAESLFFSIDRYFDIQDLAQDNINIYIQWETPAPGSIKGYSKPWLEDIESQPGKLVFAWAIPSMLTKVAGNLKFSVRFQQTDITGAVVYDLSTLPQTVKINSGLNFDLTNVQIDSTSLATITSRLKNSSIGGVFIPQPTFYVCTPEVITALEVLTSENPTRDLKVSAYPDSTDYTSISYVFSKDGEGVISSVQVVGDTATPTNNDTDIVIASVAFEESADEEAVPEKIYYSAENGGERLTTAEAAGKISNKEPIYELIITFTIKTSGTYRLSVTATYSGADPVPSYTKTQDTTPNEDKTYYVRDMAGDYHEAEIEEAFETGVIYYERLPGATINETSKEAYRIWTFEDPKAFKLDGAAFSAIDNLTNYTAETGVGLTVKAPLDTSNAADQQNGAEYTVTLKRADNNNDEGSAVGSEVTLIPTASAGNEHDFTNIKTMGYYYVTMKKSLNKCADDQLQEASSNRILITEALSQPVVTINNATRILPVNSTLQCSCEEEVNANYPIVYTYQWYKIRNTSSAPTAGAVVNNVIQHTLWEAVPGAVRKAYQPDQANYYSLVATASRNGNTQYGSSDYFTVYSI